jgi:hypothetical protein
LSCIITSNSWANRISQLLPGVPYLTIAPKHERKDL